MSRVGFEPSSGLYYEVLGKRSSPHDVPILLIHGGGATGACFRSNLDGGPGWADQLAARGYEVWVTDWPGCGRSGNQHVAEVDYGTVVGGYRHLLRDVIGEPVVVVPHSMGGATAWQLVEHEGDLLVGVVAVAASYPGNVPPRATVLREEGSVLVARFEETGVEFVIDRTRGYLYEDDYIYNQAIGSSTRFPMDKVEQMRAGLVGLPPTMLQQRIGVLPGLPAVEDTSTFAGVPIRLLAGSEDPAHRPETEQATAAQFREWGAAVSVVALSDLGMKGNGHFIFFEDNERDVLDAIDRQIAEVVAAGRAREAVRR